MPSGNRVIFDDVVVVNQSAVLPVNTWLQIGARLYNGGPSGQRTMMTTFSIEPES